MSDENKCLNKTFYIPKLETDFSSMISRFEKQLIDPKDRMKLECKVRLTRGPFSRGGLCFGGGPEADPFRGPFHPGRQRSLLFQHWSVHSEIRLCLLWLVFLHLHFSRTRRLGGGFCLGFWGIFAIFNSCG